MLAIDVSPNRQVSMESGLEGRNNAFLPLPNRRQTNRLNGVRPRRPEQSDPGLVKVNQIRHVSMESGLEGRNNATR